MTYSVMDGDSGFSSSRAMSVSGNYSQRTGILAIGKDSFVEVFYQDPTTTNTFLRGQMIDFTDDIRSASTDINTPIDGIGISPSGNEMLISNSSNMDRIGFYRRVDDSFQFQRAVQIIQNLVLQEVDTDGEIFVLVESRASGDQIGAGLLLEAGDQFFDVPASVDSNDSGLYDGGDSVNLRSINLSGAVTLGRDRFLYGYSSNTGLFSLELPVTPVVDKWDFR